MTKPILWECPFPIKTERLTIRPLMPHDGKMLNEAVIESFDSLHHWLPWATTPPTLEESETTAREFYADFILRKAFHLLIFHDDILIGMCGLHAINEDIPSAAIGYWCATKEQGKGFITEAVSALTLYGFKQLGLQRIAILCEEGNLASQRVAEKCGFTLESTGLGILKNLRSEGLIKSRCYVRFSADGLDNSTVSW